MNMLYEGLKTNSTIVVVPSTALESMQLGGLSGVAAVTAGLAKNGDGRDAAIANRGGGLDPRAEILTHAATPGRGKCRFFADVGVGAAVSARTR